MTAAPTITRRRWPAWGWTTAGLAAAVLAVALIPAVARTATTMATSDPAALRSLILAAGPLAPLLAILANVAQAVLAPIPGAAIVYLNGAVFGMWGGTVVNLIGGVAGAAACFAIARGFFRPRVARWLARRRLPQVLQGFLQEPAAGGTGVRDGLAIAAARLVPGAPFDLVSYGAGITRVGWWPFLWGTAAGSAPHAFAYAALGATLHVPLWVGVGATVALGAFVTLAKRLTVAARRALTTPTAARSPAAA